MEKEFKIGQRVQVKEEYALKYGYMNPYKRRGEVIDVERGIQVRSDQHTVGLFSADELEPLVKVLVRKTRVYLVGGEDTLLLNCDINYVRKMIVGQDANQAFMADGVNFLIRLAAVAAFESVDVDEEVAAGEEYCEPPAAEEVIAQTSNQS